MAQTQWLKDPSDKVLELIGQYLRIPLKLINGKDKAHEYYVSVLLSNIQTLNCDICSLVKYNFDTVGKMANKFM